MYEYKFWLFQNQVKERELRMSSRRMGVEGKKIIPYLLSLY